MWQLLDYNDMLKLEIYDHRINKMCFITLILIDLNGVKIAKGLSLFFYVVTLLLKNLIVFNYGI